MTILADLAIGYIVGKAAVAAYNTLLTPEQRRKIESKVKTHHFEYGVAVTTGGALAKSPKAVGTGISWIADDWKDKDEAIENIKNKVNSAVNQIRRSLQNPNRGYNNRYYSNPGLRRMYTRMRY